MYDDLGSETSISCDIPKYRCTSSTRNSDHRKIVFKSFEAHYLLFLDISKNDQMFKKKKIASNNSVQVLAILVHFLIFFVVSNVKIGPLLLPKRAFTEKEKKNTHAHHKQLLAFSRPSLSPHRYIYTLCRENSQFAYSCR